MPPEPIPPSQLSNSFVIKAQNIHTGQHSRALSTMGGLFRQHKGGRVVVGGDGEGGGGGGGGDGGEAGGRKRWPETRLSDRHIELVFEKAGRLTVHVDILRSEDKLAAAMDLLFAHIADPIPFAQRGSPFVYKEEDENWANTVLEGCDYSRVCRLPDDCNQAAACKSRSPVRVRLRQCGSMAVVMRMARMLDSRASATATELFSSTTSVLQRLAVLLSRLEGRGKGIDAWVTMCDAIEESCPPLFSDGAGMQSFMLLQFVCAESHLAYGSSLLF